MQVFSFHLEHSNVHGFVHSDDLCIQLSTVRKRYGHSVCILHHMCIRNDISIRRDHKRRTSSLLHICAAKFSDISVIDHAKHTGADLLHDVRNRVCGIPDHRALAIELRHGTRSRLRRIGRAGRFRRLLRFRRRHRLRRNARRQRRCRLLCRSLKVIKRGHQDRCKQSTDDRKNNRRHHIAANAAPGRVLRLFLPVILLVIVVRVFHVLPPLRSIRARFPLLLA